MSDDIKKLAGPVLAHRLLMKTLSTAQRSDPADELMAEMKARRGFTPT